eukprot:820785-Alexandrium_andersonii.AAC.1
MAVTGGARGDDADGMMPVMVLMVMPAVIVPMMMRTLVTVLAVMVLAKGKRAHRDKAARQGPEREHCLTTTRAT